MISKKYPHEIGYEINTLEHLIGRKIVGIVQANNFGDITMMQAWIMQFLYENREKEVYQKDIEKHFCITRSTVTSILQLMEKKGYIRRVSVMKDARLKRILLTEKAIAIQKQNSFEIHQSFERTLREGLSDEELDVFFHCIEQMKKNLIESDYPNGDVSRKEMAARSIAEEF